MTLARTAATVSLALLAPFLAGCTAEPPPADVRLTADWQAWQDDNLPHLVVGLTNYGGQTAYVGPDGHELSIIGPMGVVPIDWGGTAFARPIHGGMSVQVGFHPRAVNGTFVMAIDHAHEMPMAPPHGIYAVCIDTGCDQAILR